MNNTAIIITAIASLITSIAALITSIINIISSRNYRSQIICQFFDEIGSKYFITARKYVYNADSFAKNDKKASFIINFFHKWGQMVKLNYLPITVFDSATGIAVVRLYNRLRPMIIAQRDKNKLYADNFEWLYNKVKSTYNFSDSI